MKRNQFSKWHAVKVKAKFNYTCARCGSTENIQAHDPTGSHADWREGIALCGGCHSKEHPNVPKELFLISGHQPYWPNISARTLSKELGYHNRTIIRRAKKLGIPSGIPLSVNNKKRIAEASLSNITAELRAKYKNALTLKDVAEYLKVADRTLRRWIHDGKLKALNLDGIIRIDRQDLRDFIHKLCRSVL